MTTQLTPERGSASAAGEDATDAVGPTIASRIGGMLLILMAILVGRLLWQGAFTAYVKPTMAIPLGIAAGFLALIGGFALLRPSHESGHEHRPDGSEPAAGNAPRDLHQGHGHSDFPKVAWLLVVPLVVLTLVAPGALGANYAATTPAPKGMPFSVTALHADASGVITLKLRDLLGWATQDPQRRILHRKIRVVGMVGAVNVMPDGRTIRLSRFTIVCCAADGIPFSADLPLPNESETPSIGRWMEVVGTWNGAMTSDGWPQIDPSSIRPVAQPSEPYEL